MKEKFKNLSTPVGIVLSIVAVILFTGLLLGLGFVLGKIPGLNEQNDYLLQAIAEFIILIVFLIITFVIGYTRIFTENVAGWLRSLYTGGFFVVYCLFSLIAQIYLCGMSKAGNVRPALEIIFYIVAIFLVGLVEELVFRGVIFNLLLNSFPKTRKGITGAIVLGGVLFGLMHFVNILSGVKFTSALIQVISAALMGILFCTIYASTRNFWMLVIFHALVDFASLLSTGIFDAGNIVSQINTFSAINSLSFIMLAIPMFVMLRKSRRIRLEMLYNNIPIYDDEHEAKMLSIVSLVLGIISLVLSCIGYLIGLGIVGIFAAILSKKAKPYNNSMATAGMITSIIGIILSAIAVVLLSVVYSSDMMAQFM
ncbi:CPBP family intramembrane metalloprotease [Roseburia sp. AF15-21]|jgi:uncharacterized protein|uniref:CPBP family glutamic-type intramembrane protease n=1 Tax=Roseburia sp. AF15-21 TaxID=2293128 RepID=UPI000E4E12AA|nr:CPBP family glutamic-type intramembrane protease [Roseburia sp. AF15-21]RHR85709.1 CPBP family intramembrane metalloprotease [Roseburia sp. AF15-21]